MIVLKAFGTSAPIWVKPLFCYSLIAPICVHLALISFCGLRHVVFRKKVIHGLGYQVLHALLGVLDLYQFERRSCLCAAAMQYQARKQAKHEYIANRATTSAVSIANRVFISRRKSPYGFTCPQTNGVSPRLSSAVIRSAQADSLSTRWIISVLM